MSRFEVYLSEVSVLGTPGKQFDASMWFAVTIVKNMTADFAIVLF